MSQDFEYIHSKEINEYTPHAISDVYSFISYEFMYEFKWSTRKRNN